MKKLIVFLLMISMSIVKCLAYDFSVDGIFYKINTSNPSEVSVTYRTTSYNSYMGSVIIPESVEYDGKSYTVTSIGSFAFKDSNWLTEIFIPKTIKSFDGIAFSGCTSLDKVKISDLDAWCSIEIKATSEGYSPLTSGSKAKLVLNDKEITNLDALTNKCLKIGKYAFYGQTSLITAKIPEGVTLVDNNAFRNCTNLTYLEIPSTVANCRNLAFAGCSSLKTVKFSDADNELTLGDMGSYLYNNQFTGCPLETVYFGRKVRWNSESTNASHYYPFQSVKTFIFNTPETFNYLDDGSYNGSAQCDTYYFGPRCSSINIQGSKMSNSPDIKKIYIFSDNLEDVFIKSNAKISKAIIYVINKDQLPTLLKNVNCLAFDNLIDSKNLSNSLSWEYGAKSSLTNSDFQNNVENMLTKIDFDNQETNVGHYDSGININFYNDIWNCDIKLPISYTITPAPLTVIANDAFKTYGEANPELTCSYFGFKNNENVSVLSKLPQVETTATQLSNAGTYPIIPSGAEAKNYSFNYERGTLTINKASQEITWNQSFNNVTVGDIVALNAISSSGLPITYSVTDETIAEIFTQNGGKCVEFLKAGNVSIRANQTGNENYNEADRVSKNISVKAAEIPVESINIDTSANGIGSDGLNLNIGESKTLVVNVYPSDATDKNLIFSSANPSIATVDQTGNITGVAKGQTVIKVESTNGKTASVTVNIIQPVVSIEFDLAESGISSSDFELNVGDTKQLIVKFNPEDASDKSLVWTSSNPDVASIGSNGLVTALAAGETEITATSHNGKTTKCKLTVVRPVDGIYVDFEASGIGADGLSLNVGETHTIIVKFLNEDASDKSLVWSSENNDIASVDQNGIITAKAPGKTDIIITASNGKTTKCNVTVIQPVESISIDLDASGIDADGMKINVGETRKVYVNIYPENASDKILIFSSINNNIAQISDDGIVSGIEPGSTTILIKASSGVTMSFDVTVSQPVEELKFDFEAMEMDNEHVEINVSESKALVVRIYPENASDKSLKWVSSAEEIAFVDGVGIVTGKTPGNATITVTASSGVNAQLDVVVTDLNGIYSIYGDSEKEISIYSIDGLRIKKPLIELESGIYIINGKKYLINK